MEQLTNAWVLSYSEFDTLVGQTWPEKSGFESIPEFEWANDTDYLMRNMVGRIDEQIEEWLDEKPIFLSPHALLEGMIDKGVLPAGDYIITVSW